MDCEQLSPVASGVLGRGLLVVWDKNAVVTGQLLKEIQRFTGQTQVQCRLDEFHGLAGDDAPEASRSSPLTLGASPQKTDGGRVFRTEDFDSPLTGDSDEGFQHV